MKDFEKFCEDVYNLSHLREEEAARFIHDAYAKFGLKPNVTENDLWNWVIDRLDDEIQTQAVATNGYLEGRTWEQFFEEFNENLSSLIPNKDIRQFYRNLFWLYKRVLWSFSGIKDEKLKTLKNANEKKDKAYQNTHVHGNFGHLKHKVDSILTTWENAKKDVIRNRKQTTTKI